MAGNRGEALPKCPNYKILLYSHAFSLCFLVDSCPRDSTTLQPHARACAHTHIDTDTLDQGEWPVIEGKRFQSVPIIKYCSTHMHSPCASSLTPAQGIPTTLQPHAHARAHTHRYRHTGPRGMGGNRGEALPKCPNYKILLYSHACSLCFPIDPYPRSSHNPPPSRTRTRTRTRTHTQTDTDTLYQGKRRGIEGKRF
jgi:hypothetical protein